MKQRCCLRLSALLSCTLLPTNAIADEVWSTNQSDVVYQEDRGKTAIWTYGDESTEDSGIIFIDGFAGVTTEPGSYSSYWAQETSSRRCDTFIKSEFDRHRHPPKQVFSSTIAPKTNQPAFLMTHSSHSKSTIR